MIIIINKGLNKKGAKKMNEFIELRKKQLKNPKLRLKFALWGIDTYPGRYKPVKVGNKVGQPSKTFKRGWKSVTDYTTMGSHLGFSIPLDYINYEVIEVKM